LQRRPCRHSPGEIGFRVAGREHLFLTGPAIVAVPDKLYANFDFNFSPSGGGIPR